MIYNVKLDIFEGPMDLLLHLIKKEEIDIYKVSISKIIDEYLAYIEIMKELDINIASDFLIMAATLLEMKSKMLLPKPELTLFEAPVEEEIISTPEELIQKIVEYEKFKKIAELLSEMEKTEKRYFSRPHIKENEPEKTFFDMTVDDLALALQEILIRKNEKEKITIIVREKITVEEMKSFIIQKLKARRNINFIDIFSIEATKLQIVTAFVALLELILERKLIARQNKNFGNIELCSNLI